MHIYRNYDYICEPLPVKFEQKRPRYSLIKVQIKKFAQRCQIGTRQIPNQHPLIDQKPPKHLGYTQMQGSLKLAARPLN